MTSPPGISLSYTRHTHPRTPGHNGAIILSSSDLLLWLQFAFIISLQSARGCEAWGWTAIHHIPLIDLHRCFINTCARGHSNMSTVVSHIHTNPHACTPEEVIMTAGCCFVLLMLIPVNRATAGTVCSMAFYLRNTCFTLHIVMSWRNAIHLPVPFLCLHSLLLSGRPRGSSYGNLWGAQSPKAHTVHTTRPHPNRCARWCSHSHTCTRRECAEDQWSVKWFCYHVVCVEYIFPSTFHGRCACVCLMGCCCYCCCYVCVCVYVFAFVVSASVFFYRAEGVEAMVLKHGDSVRAAVVINVTSWYLPFNIKRL